MHGYIHAQEAGQRRVREHPDQRAENTLHIQSQIAHKV